MVNSSDLVIKQTWVQILTSVFGWLCDFWQVILTLKTSVSQNLRVRIVPTSKGCDSLELFAKGLAQCLAHTQCLMYYYCCLPLFLLLYLWPLMGPRKHQKSDLGSSSNDISIIPYTFLSWINFPFSEASRVILRPFHIHSDSSWEMLGKIYLPAPYPTESQRNCSPLTLPSQGHSWETSLELSLQLKAHKPFSPVPSPERGGTQVRRKGPSQCLALVWTLRLLGK